MSKDIQEAIRELEYIKNMKTDTGFAYSKSNTIRLQKCIETVLNYIETLEKDNKNLERKLRIKDGDVGYLQNKIRKHFIEDIEIAEKIKELQEERSLKYDNYMGYNIESREQQDIDKKIEILQELLENK